ncbi:MAG: hypothetical protein IJN19_07390 [Opitutales bacterium]|nr:hypothetical protein [Opitutales bacterium]
MSNASGAWGQVHRPSRAAGTTHSLPDALAAQWNRQLALLANLKFRIKIPCLSVRSVAQKNTAFLCSRAKISVKKIKYFFAFPRQKHPGIALVPA